MKKRSTSTNWKVLFREIYSLAITLKKDRDSWEETAFLRIFQPKESRIFLTKLFKLLEHIETLKGYDRKQAIQCLYKVIYYKAAIYERKDKQGAWKTNAEGFCKDFLDEFGITNRIPVPTSRSPKFFLAGARWRDLGYHRPLGMWEIQLVILACGSPHTLQRPGDHRPK